MTRKIFFKKSFLLIIFTLLLLNSSLTASAAVDLYLKIDDVPGEAQSSKHTGEIDVLAWSWGMAQSGTMHAGSGGGGGKVSIQDLSITKYIDKSSPVLMLYTCNGKQFPKVVLTIEHSGKTLVPYLKITMTEVIVTSLSTGGSGGQDRLTENITFNFAEVDVEYTPMNQDGTSLPPIRFGWDVAKNVQK